MLYVCMCNREAFDPQTNIPVHVPNSNTHAINIIRTIIFQRPSEIRQLCLGVALRLGVNQSGGRGMSSHGICFRFDVLEGGG